MVLWKQAPNSYSKCYIKNHLSWKVIRLAISDADIQLFFLLKLHSHKLVTLACLSGYLNAEKFVKNFTHQLLFWRSSPWCLLLMTSNSKVSVSFTLSLLCKKSNYFHDILILCWVVFCILMVNGLHICSAFQVLSSSQSASQRMSHSPIYTHNHSVLFLSHTIHTVPAQL